MRDWFRNYTSHTRMRKTLILLPSHSVRVRGLKSRLWGKNPKNSGCILHGCVDWNLHESCIYLDVLKLHSVRMRGLKCPLLLSWLNQIDYYLLCKCVDWNMSWLLRTYRLWELQIFALVAQLLFVIKIDKTCPKLIYLIWYK